MSTLLAEDARPARMPRLADVPLIVVCLAGVALIAGLDLMVDATRLVRLLGDTDDATRLTQVRELMAGAPWFDTTLARFGGAEPLVSHWSRLVDLPIVLLVRLFSIALAPATAELAARFVWPLVVLTAVLALIAGNVARRSDRAAAASAVLLVVTALSAMSQFLPGRIDHHNAMLLGAVGGVLVLARGFDNPRMGWVAGALLGLGTAVGYEAVLLTAAVLAMANLYALATGRGGEAAWRASAAFAATLALALVATTAPSRLLVSHCDALSINMVLLAALAAAGSYAALVPLARARLPLRLAALAAAGGVGLVLYVMAKPVCVGGPFAEVDRAAVPIWLDTVLETQSIFWMISSSPGPGLVAAVFVALGGAAAAWLATRERSDASLLLAATTLLAAALGAWQIKLLPYATLLAATALAVAIAHVARAAPSRPGAVRVVATLALSQVALLALLLPVLSAAGLDRPEKRAVKNGMTECLARKSVAPLAGLAPGFVVADIDLGPFIVAETRLNVLGAPYHRIGGAIAETYRVMYGAEAEAQTRLHRLGAKYLAVCPGLATGLVKPVPKTGLRADLLAGRAPHWLEPIQLAGATPIRVWRVK